MLTFTKVRDEKNTTIATFEIEPAKGETLEDEEKSLITMWLKFHCAAITTKVSSPTLLCISIRHDFNSCLDVPFKDFLTTLDLREY